MEIENQDFDRYDFLGLISHFYEESCMYGGWPIYIKEDLVFLVESEFPYLELYECETNGKFMVKRKEDVEVTDVHKIEVLLDERDMYSLECDKYYDGVKDLFQF